MNIIKELARTIIVIMILVAGVSLVSAWTAPTQAPPGGNVAAPVNVGALSQVKTGALQVNGFRNIGNSIFDGNVGIGTAAPTQKLDVAGDIKTNAGIWLGGVRKTDWPSGGGKIPLISANGPFMYPDNTILNTSSAGPNYDDAIRGNFTCTFFTQDGEMYTKMQWNSPYVGNLEKTIKGSGLILTYGGTKYSCLAQAVSKTENAAWVGATWMKWIHSSHKFLATISISKPPPDEAGGGT